MRTPAAKQVGTHLASWAPHARTAERTLAAGTPVLATSGILARDRFRSLLELAGQDRRHAWIAGTPLADVRNAHYANTADQLESALRGNFTSFEADVRMQNGVAVVAHDRDAKPSMTFGEWLQIVKPTGARVRIDAKDPAAIKPAMQSARSQGMSDTLLGVNLSANLPDFTPSKASHILHGDPVDESVVHELRAHHPQMLISLNVPEDVPAAYTALGRQAQRVGGPVMVALEAQNVTPQAVAAIRPHALVGVWNYPQTFMPADIEAETRRLRSLGVDGVIDLRNDLTGGLEP